MSQEKMSLEYMSFRNKCRTINIMIWWDFFQADSTNVSWHGCWCWYRNIIILIVRRLFLNDIYSNDIFSCDVYSHQTFILTTFIPSDIYSQWHLFLMTFIPIDVYSQWHLFLATFIPKTFIPKNGNKCH